MKDVSTNHLKKNKAKPETPVYLGCVDYIVVLQGIHNILRKVAVA